MAYYGIKIKIGNTATFETATKYNIYVQDFPFIPVPIKQKNVFSQSWYDENGDDEYLPATPTYEPIIITIPFVYKGLLNTAITNIQSFIAELQGVEFKMYDTYSKVGRQKCRLVSYDDSKSTMVRQGYAESDATQKVLAAFALEIKINDPVTNITL